MNIVDESDFLNFIPQYLLCTVDRWRLRGRGRWDWKAALFSPLLLPTLLDRLCTGPEMSYLTDFFLVG